MAPQSISSRSVHQAGDVTPSLPIGYDKQNDKRVSTDPDLQRVIDAWADLPEVIKAWMLAMVNASVIQE